MAKELWIFEVYVDMAAPEWCQLSLGTRSILLHNTGYKLGVTKNESNPKVPQSVT